MKIRILPILVLITLLSFPVLTIKAQEPEREVIFSDDFSGYGKGVSLQDKWSAFSGNWYVKDDTLHQDAGGFDHGIVVKDLYLRCDYRIEAKVKLVGGGAGAGLYWNVYDARTGESGHMLRYDGHKPIMYGWMHGRGFLGTGGATGELYADDTWHTIRMDVNNSKSTFDVYWDGKKIADAAPLFYKSGYAGLQCSLGYSVFDDFTISVDKGTDWRAVPSGEVKPEWVQSIALMPDGNIVYSVRNMHRIQIVTPDGKLVREFGQWGDAPGQMKLPSAVATDRQGKIYVTESGNRRVQVFDAEGKSLAIHKLEGKSALDMPFGIAVDNDGRIWVSDVGNDRIVCFGQTTVAIGGHGSAPGQFNKPQHLSMINEKLYVADMNNRRIQVFNPLKPFDAPEIIPMKEPVRFVQSNGKGLYVVGSHVTSTYDRNWKKLNEFAGGASDHVWPDYALFDKAGNILIADGWMGRIITVDSALTEVKPEVSGITGNSAVITWKSPTLTPTKVMLLDSPVGASLPRYTDYSKGTNFGDGKPRTEHRVELTGLKPGTRHVFALSSPSKQIPEGGQSLDYRFTTLPPDGMMAYTEVPLAVLVYCHVTNEAHKKPDGSPSDPVIRGDDYFQRQILYHEAMRYFYLINSWFKLDTNCRYMKIDRPTDIAHLGSSSEVIYYDLEELAKREGLKPTDFGAVIVAGGAGYYAYPWPTPWWGGHLTYTTGCCFIGGGDTWLSTHEFHHLTEGWMSMTSTRGYTNADMPWTHPARVGENYDFLASTLRIMPPEIYLNLAVGVLKLTADKDGDGVPDDEPRMVFDEKRAGTSPDNAYSYDNRLNDLQNITAAIFTPAVKGHEHPLLTKQINLKYPFAVFDYNYEVKKGTPVIDGIMKSGEWERFISTPNASNPANPDLPWGAVYRPVEGADYRMETFLHWDDDYVYYAATAPYKFHISVLLDAQADGFFRGKDNVNIGVAIPRDESTVPPETKLPPPGVMIWNNVEPVKERGIPEWTNHLYDRNDDIEWAWGKDDRGWYVIEIALPKCPNVDLVPKEGQEMGVRFWLQGYLPPTEENKDPRYTFEMFDSCEYGYFKLVK